MNPTAPPVEPISSEPGPIGFISAPGSSIFIREVLSAVAAEVAGLGIPVLEHDGFLTEVAELCSHFVVVPHEYLAVAPFEAKTLYGRTVAFGVEHPGTSTFERSVELGSRFGARMEISLESTEELGRRGISATHFQLGYCGAWDFWRGQPKHRDIDVVYLGTADKRRCRLLAEYAESLAGLTTELLVPPHEPMTGPRPDFLIGPEKWALLARSKIILCLHREDKTAFEWVRGVEAMINGCVVLAEPSTDLGPLVPGRHFLSAPTQDLGMMARAAVYAPRTLDDIALRAYDLVTGDLTMRPSASALVQLAARLPVSRNPHSRDSRSFQLPHADSDKPMAVWIPSVQRLPDGKPTNGPHDSTRIFDESRLSTTTTTVSDIAASGDRRLDASASVIDVLCLSDSFDGPLGVTTASLDRAGVGFELHLGTIFPHATSLVGMADGCTTELSIQRGFQRGHLRNRLMASGSRDLVLILNAGDQVFPGVLPELVRMCRDDANISVAFSMATYGGNQLANVLVPEFRRLRSRAYLTRGYLVRRSWLERLGGFSEDPYLDEFLDHDFWLRSVAEGGRAQLLRSIGFALYADKGRPSLSQTSPTTVRGRIDAVTARYVT